MWTNLPCSGCSIVRVLGLSAVSQRQVPCNSSEDNVSLLRLRFGVLSQNWRSVCKAVYMHKWWHDTAYYRAVPFDTPHARSCFKFWAREREQRNYAVHATTTAKRICMLMAHSSSVRWTQTRRSPCQLRGNFVGSGVMVYKDEPTSSYANYHVNLIMSAVRWTQLTYRIYVDSETAISESTLYIGKKWINWLGISVKGRLSQLH